MRQAAIHVHFSQKQKSVETFLNFKIMKITQFSTVQLGAHMAPILKTYHG